MKWSDILIETSTAVLRDRSNIVSGPSDELWSDEQLLRYLNDAENRFCRRGLVLRDGTTEEVISFKLKTDQVEYPLHPSVLAVVSAKLEGDEVDLVRLGHTILNAQRTIFPAQVYPEWAWATPVTPGRPNGYLSDDYLVHSDGVSKVVLRFNRIPTADENGLEVRMRVCRLPLCEATVDTLDNSPEIPEDYHLDLTEWAAFRALRNHDADTEALAKASAHEARFKKAVEECRFDQLRKMFTPVGWGFGANGWAWPTNSGGY